MHQWVESEVKLAVQTIRLTTLSLNIPLARWTDRRASRVALVQAVLVFFLEVGNDRLAFATEGPFYESHGQLVCLALGFRGDDDIRWVEKLRHLVPALIDLDPVGEAFVFIP